MVEQVPIYSWIKVSTALIGMSEPPAQLALTESAAMHGVPGVTRMPTELEYWSRLELQVASADIMDKQDREKCGNYDIG